MSREQPPLLLRLAVVVGAFTLLLGAVGIVMVALRSDDYASAAGPGLQERVRVVGAADDALFVVHVRWEAGSIQHREAALGLSVPGHGGAGSRAGHLFKLPPDLAGHDVVIEVLDARTSQILASREVLLRKGEEVRIEVGSTTER